MVIPISQSVGLVYRYVVKPLLFLQSPDRVHSSTIHLGIFANRIPGVKTVLRAVFRFDKPHSLSQTIDDVTFMNPVGLAAGLDKNAELLPLMPAVGFGFTTIGSVTNLPCKGNPKPWYYRLPKQKSLVVHTGLANNGATEVIGRILRYNPKVVKHHPIVLSVAKTNVPDVCTDKAAIDDYINTIASIRGNRTISIVEINISCPNTYGGEPFTDALRLERLLHATDALDIAQPIWIKMPINLPWVEFKSLLDVITAHDVQGVTIGNLNKSRESLGESELPEAILGNLSGLPTQQLSDSLISQTYQQYGHKLTIVGVGGIFNAEDAYRKICLGSSLVEMITGVIFEGPQVVGQINRDIDKFLVRDGFDSIQQAIGSAQ